MALSKTQLRIVNVLHGIQLFLAAGVLGIGIYKMFFVKNRAAASGGRWALSVAAKSMIIISYQVLTENVQSLNRWASVKAFFILDILEVCFWPAAIVLTVIGMTKYCEGTSCILSGVTIGLAAILTILGLPLVWIAFKHWREHRAERKETEANLESSSMPMRQYVAKYPSTESA